MTAPEIDVCHDCGFDDGKGEHQLHSCKVCSHLVCEGCSSDHAITECGWSELLE